MVIRRAPRVIPILIGVLLSLGTVRGSSAAASKTLENLQSAYNGESNAHAKYLEFAKRADQEGYGKVASLFSAAAAAEQIHLTCEGSVLKEMDATPTADIKAAPVKSTKQNLLDSANKGEAYERDTMYPRFIKQAHKDNNAKAAQCFAWAQAAEAEHFKLFRQAASNLSQMKGPAGTYYVCREGGYTMADLDAAKCPGGAYDEVK